MKSRTPKPKKPTQADINEYILLQDSPIYFIKVMWKLSPQPIKPEFQGLINLLITQGKLNEITADYFVSKTREECFKEKLYSWQQWVILLAIEASIKKQSPDRISVRSGHGIGKMQKDDDLLETTEGAKMVKDILIGECLFGVDGKPNMIVNKTRFENIPMFRVSFSDGTFLDVSSGHLWNVRGRQERRKELEGWRTIETLELYKLGAKRSNGKNETKTWELPKYNPVEFNYKKVPIDPYLYGCWLGDGTKGKNSYSCSQTDLEHFLTEFSNFYKIGTVDNDYFTVLGFFKDFQILNKNAKTNELQINDLYKHNSVDYRLWLLQGLLDTDGWVEKNGTTVGFVSISEKLADDVLWLARSLGLVARKGKNKNPFYYKGEERIYCKTAYCVSITATTDFNLFRLKRKQELLHEPETRYSKRWISDIQPIENASGYCFSLERELYLAKDFIVTHNSTTLSWVLLWYLYTHYLAMVNCTAPTGDQMYDVLWKEVSKWLKLLPFHVQQKFEWQANYIRIVEHPEAWFARARTARKESPEALAGMHGENMLALIDEASGVHDEIFNTMEGSLTDYKPMIIMISNPTRLTGYFYDSHKGQDAVNWQKLAFSCEQSPFVDEAYVERIITKHGKDSDEYRIRVLGEFPREDAVDEQGYVPLLSKNDIKEIPRSEDNNFFGTIRLGIDPAGEGKDKTAWVARDAFRAKVVQEEPVSNPKGIAQRTIGICELYGIKADDVYVDMFGIGAETVKELYLSNFYVNSVMVGDKPDDDEDIERFLNKRACFYFRLRKWIKSGGELEQHKAWEEELTSVRYRRSSGHQRIQMMSKKEARSKGYHSPNVADAAMLTFTDSSEDYGKVETVTPATFQNKKYETVVHSSNNLHSAI